VTCPRAHVRFSSDTHSSHASVTLCCNTELVLFRSYFTDVSHPLHAVYLSLDPMKHLKHFIYNFYELQIFNNLSKIFYDAMMAGHMDLAR